MDINLKVILMIGLYLTGLFCYMYGRMAVMSEEKAEGTYYPNMRRSTIELIVFMLMYLGCSALVIYPETHVLFSLVSMLGAFVLSLLIFNSATFNLLKIAVIPFSLVIMIGFYIAIGYFYTLL